MTLEKILKAIIVQRTQQHAPHIHDLVILAKRAGITLTQKDTENLETITTFNIAGRYADDKSNFYKIYNKKSTAQQYLKITEKLIIWLEKELTKK